MTTSKNPNIANFKFLFHIFQVFKAHIGLPWWLSGKESACQCRRPRFKSWVRKIPWRRKWQPHSSTLVWEIPRTEEPGSYNHAVAEELDTT